MFPQTSTVLVQNPVSSPLGGITLAGVARGGHGVPGPNRVLGRYSLVYVFEGDGTYSDNSVSNQPIAAGDLIQISPHTRHSYGPKSDKGWHEVYIIFEGPVFDAWSQENCFDIGCSIVPLRPIEYWRNRFLNTIVGSGKRDQQYGGMEEVLRVQSLLLDIHKALAAETSGDTEWLSSAKHLLTEHTSSQSVASALGMSYEAFRKRFRREQGIPPARYHANLLMQRACDLLSTSQLPVKEIARQLEYCDEFHFSKRFSQIVGCSPTAYRARTLS